MINAWPVGEVFLKARRHGLQIPNAPKSDVHLSLMLQKTFVLMQCPVSSTLTHCTGCMSPEGLDHGNQWIESCHCDFDCLAHRSHSSAVLFALSVLPVWDVEIIGPFVYVIQEFTWVFTARDRGGVYVNIVDIVDSKESVQVPVKRDGHMPHVARFYSTHGRLRPRQPNFAAGSEASAKSHSKQYPQ